MTVWMMMNCVFSRALGIKKTESSTCETCKFMCNGEMKMLKNTAIFSGV